VALTLDAFGELPVAGTWLVWSGAMIDGREVLVEWTGRGVNASQWEVLSPWGPRYVALDSLRHATAHDLLTMDEDEA